MKKAPIILIAVLSVALFMNTLLGGDIVQAIAAVVGSVGGGLVGIYITERLIAKMKRK
ncbi:MAG: hypothetical protein QXO22_04290 [Thermosphaera sp.]